MAKKIHSIEPGTNQRLFVNEEQKKHFSEAELQAALKGLVKCGLVLQIGDKYKFNDDAALIADIFDKINELIENQGPMTFNQIRAAMPDIPEKLIKQALEVFYAA